MMASSNNPYNKTVWIDHIVDTSKNPDDPNYVIQEGTRFTARRANNVEDGVYNAYESLDQLNRSIKRLRIQLEIDGRLPGNSGSYVDAFDSNPTRLAMETAEADLTSAANEGTTTLSVSDASVFEANTEVTLFDGDKFEDVIITQVNTKTIYVDAIKNRFEKGAKVARSNVLIDLEENEMRLGSAGTYSISAEVL